MATATTSNRTYATGKRKTAIARVWLKPGTGDIVVNGLPCDEYFERETSRMVLRQGLELIEVQDQFDVMATCHGGGKNAQAEAMRHGISRALCAFDPEKRGALKRAGFLTRDARKKERKKYGQPGARKRFQYSKR
ncbi:MAG: 30S ribosomal protein S9 [Polyangiaceae bacterium]|jgi:small subunit ribosomal protein S9